MHLNEFEFFLLFGGSVGNPANRIQNLEARPWAAKFLNKYYEQEDSGIHPGEPGALSPLGRWAVVESLNTGSHQRASLPPAISSALAGSGRWMAQDEGGWFSLLRDSVIEWFDLTTMPSRLDYRRAARLMLIQVKALKEPEAAEARRQAAAEARHAAELIDQLSRFLPGEKLSPALEVMYNNSKKEEIDRRLGNVTIVPACNQECPPEHEIEPCPTCPHYAGWRARDWAEGGQRNE